MENNNKIKRDLLYSLSNASAVVNTEIMQWCVELGIEKLFPKTFSATLMANSAFQELKPELAQSLPKFIQVREDLWSKYHNGIIYEPNNDTWVLKGVDEIEEERVYFSINGEISQYNFTKTSAEFKEKLTKIRRCCSDKHSDTTETQSKGLVVFLHNQLVGRASASTANTKGDCGNFELMAKLEIDRGLGIGLTADRSLRKDYEHSNYLTVGFDALLGFWIDKGFISLNKAIYYHDKIKKNGGWLGVQNFTKWYNTQIYNQTYLRLFNLLKQKNVISD